MYLYVELWKAKPKWLALSQEEREEYMSKVGPYIQPIINAEGVEFLSVFNDSDISHRVDYGYFNVWKMPNKELIHQLEEGVEQVDWHQYFEQVNAGGAIVTLDTQVNDALSL